MSVKLNTPLSIGPGYQQRGIASFFTDISGYNFINIKTSIPHQSYVMPMIELIGYNYATAQPIRTAFVIYTYSYLISGSQNAYNGMTPYGTYISSDNYVCLKLFMPNTYYVGFSMDAYSVAGNGAQYEVGIIAAAATSSPGNIYQ